MPTSRRLFLPPEPTNLVEKLLKLASAVEVARCPDDGQEVDIHLHGGASCPECGQEFEVERGGRLVPMAGLEGWAATWPSTLPDHWASPLIPKAHQAVELMHDGGFSLDRNLDLITDLNYVVSISGAERQIPIGILTPNDILSYRAEHADALDGGMIFGGWFDGGLAYLDLSRNFTDLNSAMAFAEANQQLAIWDSANSFAIPVNQQFVHADQLPEVA